MKIIKNISKILKSGIGVLGIAIGIAIMAIPAYYFMEMELIIGNLGFGFYLLEMSLTVIISLLFGLFIGATLFKINHFSVKKSGIGIAGGFLGALVSGCPACSVTLASYLGFAGFISIFPYSGVELKVASVFILLYANFSTIKNLETCKI